MSKPSHPRTLADTEAQDVGTVNKVTLSFTL